ncbi:bifunctional 3-oxoadipate enol-lactonase/4-carboxymuconolactone decarboxylase PcaDC [Spirosoma rhododendri]|nr:3-oxoadipate enol-lactonase [Spirosoma rhododendri]
MNTHYQIDGETGPVLVFSNSLGADLIMWDKVVPRLLPHFRILRYDTRGHGQTPVSAEPFTITDLGLDVLNLLDKLAIDKIVFCGLSMGGLIGQWLAINHPERVERLILSNTAAKIGNDTTWNERIDRVRQVGLPAIVDGVLDRWLTPDYRQANPAELAQLRDSFLRNTVAGYAACCEAIRDVDFRETIGQISAPTLVIAGTHDPVTTVADGQFLQQHIPGAQLVELSAAHVSAIESPDAFTDAIRSFLIAEAPKQSVYDAGMAVRRAVLGDAHVDRATTGITDFNGEFQDFITRYAWGEIWTRPGLPRHSRSLITLGMLIALNREAEFKMHVRAAFNNGVTIDEIKEVIMHSALYCGLPAANAAFHAAQDVIAMEHKNL